MTKFSSSEKHDRFHGRVIHDPPLPCAWGDCLAHGEFRAPSNKTEQTEPIWLCLNHIRDYNAGWDYFKGLDEDQINAFMADNAAWHRPTWPMGDSAKSGHGAAVKDPLELREFAGGLAAGPGAGPLDRPLTRKDMKALKTLGLEHTSGEGSTTARVIKERFRDLVKRYHPDRNQNDPKAAILLREAIEAYNHLADALKNNNSSSADGK